MSSVRGGMVKALRDHFYYSAASGGCWGWHTAVAQLWVFTQCSVWAQRGSERFPAPGGDILQCNNYESKIDMLKYIKLSRNYPCLSNFCSIEFNSSTFSANYPPLLPVPFSWDQWGELGSASALGYWALSTQSVAVSGGNRSPVITSDIHISESQAAASESDLRLY